MSFRPVAVAVIPYPTIRRRGWVGGTPPLFRLEGVLAAATASLVQPMRDEQCTKPTRIVAASVLRCERRHGCPEEMRMHTAGAIERTLAQIVDLLVKKSYAELERITHGVRLRAPEIEEAVRDYGRTIAQP